jgi:hypothetical protein
MALLAVASSVVLALLVWRQAVLGARNKRAYGVAEQMPRSTATLFRQLAENIVGVIWIAELPEARRERAVLSRYGCRWRQRSETSGHPGSPAMDLGSRASPVDYQLKDGRPRRQRPGDYARRRRSLTWHESC